MGDKTRKEAPEPPESLSEDAKAAWREVIAAYGPCPERIAGPLLEEYAQQIAIARRARARVDEEGLIVGNAKGEPVPHPALAVERRALEAMSRLAGRMESPPRRRDGYMVEATRKALAAAPDVKDQERFKGAVAATMTLAWIIDEAQRAGGEALRRAAYGPIPSYLKAVRELGLTPVVQAVDAVQAADEAPVTDLGKWMAKRAGG